MAVMLESLEWVSLVRPSFPIRRPLFVYCSSFRERAVSFRTIVPPCARRRPPPLTTAGPFARRLSPLVGPPRFSKESGIEIISMKDQKNPKADDFCVETATIYHSLAV